MTAQVLDGKALAAEVRAGLARRVAALGMATGSCTDTIAPSATSRSQTARLGESRTSSLSGLNATPSTATRLSASEPPAFWRASATTRSRRLRLIESRPRRTTW